jgi:ABC-type dipeptide/oligopeptide/nickel transport system permease subunit
VSGGPAPAVTEPATTPPATTKSRSTVRIALARLRADRIAVVCAAVVVVFVLIAILADVLIAITGTDPSGFRPELTDDFGFPLVGVGLEHPFGLEPNTGRDLFARWVLGCRISLSIGFSTAVLTTLIGTVAGLLAGYFGGLIDLVISRLVDVLLSLPMMLVAIAAVPVVGSYVRTASGEVQGTVRMVVLVTVLTVFGWTTTARLIRGEVLSLREREFVQAAHAIGVRTHQVLFRELLPNLLGPIIVAFSLALPTYIGAEAGLSLLGIGVVEPTPSWGRTIADARGYFSSYPEYLLQPVLGIAVLVLALNLLGDAVRDAFDPKTRT